MNFKRKNYFKRQTTLPEIGKDGQNLLQQAKVLVIGCGGLGSPVAIYLAASGIGEIHLVDFDTVSVSNLHRQVFYKLSDINKPKAEILANEIKIRTPFTKVTFSKDAVNKKSILKLLSAYDVIVDATDSLPIKYLINDACVISKKPLVYGSLYKFDGYVATFNVKDGKGKFSCNLRDAFPNIASDIPNCEEAGTLNPIVGVIALLQVNEVVKLITKTGKLLVNQLLIYNTLENSQFKMKLRKNDVINMIEVFRNSDYLDVFCETQNKELVISSTEFKKINSTSDIEIISVLNHIDAPIPFKVHHKLPYKSFDINNFTPNLSKKYIVVCKKGITSYDVALKMKEKFPNIQVWSLQNGIEDFN